MLLTNKVCDLWDWLLTYWPYCDRPQIPLLQSVSSLFCWRFNPGNLKMMIISGCIIYNNDICLIASNLYPCRDISAVCAWKKVCGIMFWSHIENNVCTWVTNCFSIHERGILVFISCFATQEINTKITLERAQKQFLMRVHTLWYLLHDITMIKMTIKRQSSHIDPVTSCFTRWVLLMTSQSVVDDIVISRQLWCDHMNNDI